MPDGSLRIKTKIDNSNLDKDIQALEIKIKKIQNDMSKNSIEQKGLEGEIQKFDELCQQANAYKQKIQELKVEKDAMFKSNPALAFQGNMPEYENIKIKLEEVKQKYAQTTVELDKQSPKIDKIALKLQKVKLKQEENNTRMQEYKQKIEEAKNKQKELGYSGAGISKSISSGIKSILKYGMALMGLRSIYGVLSAAMSSWLNGNSKGAKQLKSDIDYMKNALGRALSPVLKYIVNLLYQAMGIAGALIKTFTGIDIFAGSVADYMSSTTSSASATNKELKKQLTSFDRINKLDNNKDSSGSGSGGGTILPSQNLSSVMNKYMDFAEKIKEIFGDIKEYVSAIGIAIAGWNLGELMGLKTKQKLGISLIVSGLYLAIDGLKKLAEGEMSPKNIIQVLIGAVAAAYGFTALVGVGLSITLPISLGLAVSAIIVTCTKNKANSTIWKPIKDALGLEEGPNKEWVEAMDLTIGLTLITFDFTKAIFGEKGAFNLLRSVAETIAEWLAKVIEKIPILGKPIAKSIRTRNTSI